MTKYIMAIYHSQYVMFLLTYIFFWEADLISCVICESVGTDFFFIFFCSSLLKGGASHKDVDNNTILRIYYESRVFMII